MLARHLTASTTNTKVNGDPAPLAAAASRIAEGQDRCVEVGANEC